MKKIIYSLFLILLLLTSCAKEEKKEDGQKEKVVKVVHLVNGFLGDKSFHDSAARGLENLEKKYGNAFEYKTVEMTTDVTKFLPTLYEYAESKEWDIIVVGTWQMVDPLMDVAKKHPEQKFIIYDDAVDYTSSDFKNVYSVKFKQNEGAFLAGFLASKLTVLENDPHINPDDKKIGFLGGMSNPVINDFLIGYVEGARYNDPKTEVVVSYVNDFFDTAKAKELALMQYRTMGVDIGFNVASLAGLGQIDAAQEENRYAIGVDSDQADLVGGEKAKLIPTSVLKNVDKAIERAVELHIEGKLAYGSEEILGLEDDAVGLCKNSYYSKTIPQAIRSEIERVEEELRTGKIKVSTSIGKSDRDIESLIRMPE